MRSSLSFPRKRESDSHFRENDKGWRFGIVVSRFNPEITQRLLRGAADFLRSKKAGVEVVRVPGAFELPQAAAKMAATGRYRAIVAVGCILEGETSHHRYLSQAALTGLILAGVTSGVPVTSGLITARSWKLALARSQPKGLNRGREAARAAWELTRER